MKINCSYTDLIDIDLLVANPRNPNKHPDEQIKLLAKIMKHQGWRSPIVVSKRSGFIVKGHGRLMAAKLNGWTQAPVDKQDYSTEADEYADMVADNKIAELSETDMDMVNLDASMFPDLDLDLLGVPDLELIEVNTIDPNADPDEVPEPPVEPKTKRGDIYKLGNHRLMCGDSTMIDDVEKLMDGEKADMVFTDPPYGVKVVKSGMVGANFGVAKKGQYSEIIGDETTDTAKEFYQTCQSVGFKNFIIWGGNYFTEFLSPSKSWIIWNKRDNTEIKNTFADGEMAWSNIGHPVRIYGQLWNGMIRSGEKDKRVHPTQKPIALAEFCFDLLKENVNVFDGFGGSGSTLIACEKTNRKCFMMELDTHYCDVIVARWEKYTGNKAELING